MFRANIDFLVKIELNKKVMWALWRQRKSRNLNKYILDCFSEYAQPLTKTQVIGIFR